MTVRSQKEFEHKEKRTGVYMPERSFGAVYCTIPLPAGAETDKAEAKFPRNWAKVVLWWRSTASEYP